MWSGLYDFWWWELKDIERAARGNQLELTSFSLELLHPNILYDPVLASGSCEFEFAQLPPDTHWGYCLYCSCYLYVLVASCCWGCRKQLVLLLLKLLLKSSDCSFFLFFSLASCCGIALKLNYRSRHWHWMRTLHDCWYLFSSFW